MNQNKVGIVTLPGRYNYGNRLQNYATTVIYSRLGFQPQTLQMPKRANVARDAKRLVKRLLGRIPQDPEALMTPGRMEAFDRFDSLIPSIVIDSFGDPSLSSFDYYSVGSDQVWNPNLIRYNEDWYYLEFAQPDRRIALAPSIGVDELDPRSVSRFKRGVAGFQKLSVREKRGAEMIKRHCGLEATVICDPTLVLSADDWRGVADSRMTPTDAYVFTYLLGGLNEESAEVVDRASRHGALPVIALSDRQRPGEPDAGPSEFVSLIDNASHVITDSFHAAVFSAILETPLTIVRRQGGSNMFGRLETLAQMLGIEGKVYGSSSYDPTLSGEYAGVLPAILRERDAFLAYLRGCLNV